MSNQHFFYRHKIAESNMSYDVSVAASFFSYYLSCFLFLLIKILLFFFSFGGYFSPFVCLYKPYLPFWVTWPMMDPYWDILKPKSQKKKFFSKKNFRSLFLKSNFSNNNRIKCGNFHRTNYRVFFSLSLFLFIDKLDN